MIKIKQKHKSEPQIMNYTETTRQKLGSQMIWFNNEALSAKAIDALIMMQAGVIDIAHNI